MATLSLYNKKLVEFDSLKVILESRALKSAISTLPDYDQKQRFVDKLLHFYEPRDDVDYENLVKVLLERPYSLPFILYNIKNV